MNKKESRFNNSAVFCMAPWVHLHTVSKGKVYQCCMAPYDKELGNIKHSTLFEIWNNEDMKTLRNNMLSNKKTESCQRCYVAEKIGNSSVRKSLQSPS